MANIVPSHITFDTLAKSNMPPAQKTAIRRWYESIQGDGAQAAMARAKLHASAAVEGVRAGGESLMVGGILGGLAATLPDGLDYQKKFPIDAAVGIMGIAGGAVLAHEHIGGDLKNAGAAALAVFSFRKSFGVVAEMRKKAGKAVAQFNGEDGGDDSDIGAEDPIVAAARYL